jgi:hypothetical protein
MKRHKILSNILRSLSWKTEDHKNHEDHKNLAISLSSENHEDHKARLTLRPLQYDFFKFVYSDLGNDYYGLTDFKNRKVFINIKKPLAYRIVTIGHESFHVWINELCKGLKGKLLPEFGNACLDILDYYLTDFAYFYKSAVQLCGFRKSFIILLDRYGFLFERSMNKKWWDVYKKTKKSTFSGKPKNLGRNWGELAK